MNNVLDTNSIVVGVDVHKFNHVAVAMDCFGQEKGSLSFSNLKLTEFNEFLYSQGSKENTLVALEDVNGYGVHIVNSLITEGFKIRYVPGILTERDRKQSIYRDKSDIFDARRVGKVILTKFEETLPAKESISTLEERLICLEFDLLLCERRDLVGSKTILKNQLHALIHQLLGDTYGDNFKRTKTFTKRTIPYYQKVVLAIKQSPLTRGILRRLSRLKLVMDQILSIDKEIAKAAKDDKIIEVLTKNISGCGQVTAALIVSQVMTVRRFANKAKFAKYAGIAPTQRSSGRKTQLHTSPFGNRILNKAIHTIALYQISRKNSQGRIYFEKKVKEGKTKLWALRCLKRQISNKVFNTLKYVN
ncbi:hypothetical protein A3D00_05245 [Candidatus Woesebacteria bacterium RIFCSPHIGHO2_02_FULL_38_9]|nr:MAG: hypothetical protein A3D00_05245 [Candidatus Woesebacteria bacterium RIFCSPHIGHO2_02_FULL_38_9]